MQSNLSGRKIQPAFWLWPTLEYPLKSIDFVSHEQKNQSISPQESTAFQQPLNHIVCTRILPRTTFDFLLKQLLTFYVLEFSSVLKCEAKSRFANYNATASQNWASGLTQLRIIFGSPPSFNVFVCKIQKIVLGPLETVVSHLVFEHTLAPAEQRGPTKIDL